MLTSTLKERDLSTCLPSIQTKEHRSEGGQGFNLVRSVGGQGFNLVRSEGGQRV